MKKRIMVDMSATLLHHGHIRLLKEAANLGEVIVGLTSDKEVQRRKGYQPELTYQHRAEILNAIRWVSEVVETPWLINEAILDHYQIDLLVHGDDNANEVPPERLVILPRTKGISSDILRARAGDTLKARGPSDQEDG